MCACAYITVLNAYCSNAMHPKIRIHPKNAKNPKSAEKNDYRHEVVPIILQKVE